MTNDVFTKVVNRQKTAIAAEFQRTSGVADSVGYHATFYGDASEVNNLLDKYGARTSESIQSIVDAVADVEKAARIDIVPQA